VHKEAGGAGVGTVRAKNCSPGADPSLESAKAAAMEILASYPIEFVVSSPLPRARNPGEPMLHYPNGETFPGVHWTTENLVSI
jgi:hypothetical protein